MPDNFTPMDFYIWMAAAGVSVLILIALFMLVAMTWVLRRE